MDSIHWYKLVTGDESVNAVAQRAQVVQTTLNRQINAGELTPEIVVAIARGYDAPVLDGLVCCGLITADEAELKERMGVEEALWDATDLQLLHELVRRVDTDGALEHQDLVTDLDEDHPAMSEPGLHSVQKLSEEARNLPDEERSAASDYDLNSYEQHTYDD